jgi:hypothetical protein
LPAGESGPDTVRSREASAPSRRISDVRASRAAAFRSARVIFGCSACHNLPAQSTEAFDKLLVPCRRILSSALRGFWVAACTMFTMS